MDDASQPNGTYQLRGSSLGPTPAAPAARPVAPASEWAAGEPTRASGGSESEDVSFGTVRISRRVLRTVVEQATLTVPGVAHMVRGPRRWYHLLGRPLPLHGVALAVDQQRVSADLYLVVVPGANMVEVGAAVQDAVAAAIERILGMSVREINVYIQDVE